MSDRKRERPAPGTRWWVAYPGTATEPSEVEVVPGDSGKGDAYVLGYFVEDIDSRDLEPCNFTISSLVTRCEALEELQNYEIGLVRGAEAFARIANLRLDAFNEQYGAELHRLRKERGDYAKSQTPR